MDGPRHQSVPPEPGLVTPGVQSQVTGSALWAACVLQGAHLRGHMHPRVAWICVFIMPVVHKRKDSVSKKRQRFLIHTKAPEG